MLVVEAAKELPTSAKKEDTPKMIVELSSPPTVTKLPAWMDAYQAQNNPSQNQRNNTTQDDNDD